MKSTIVNTYSYPSFFNHYYNSDEEWLNRYEAPLLDYVKSTIPSYVDSVLNFGCANGRDFLPFQDSYNCFGFDLANIEHIKWTCKQDNLHYFQCSIEDYLDSVDHSETNLSTSLVYTQGTLMYLTPENQNRFIEHLLEKGCKNIVLHEYPPDYTGPHGKFNPKSELLEMFTRQHFREIVEGQPTGFIYLNK